MRIIFFLFFRVSVLIVVYIAAGIAFAVYKGKSGVEMIPNYAFWKDFPYLVKVNYFNTKKNRFLYDLVDPIQ